MTDTIPSVLQDTYVLHDNSFSLLNNVSHTEQYKQEASLVHKTVYMYIGSHEYTVEPSLVDTNGT